MNDIKQLIEILSQAEGSLSVAKDIALQSDKEAADRACQALLAHAKAAIIAAKMTAVQHRLQISFLGYTLRYPEDCAAGYQLTEDLDELERSYPSYAESQKELRETIQPKFMSDNVWLSSENCSDQGLALFSVYDDFAMNRGEFIWVSPEKRAKRIKDRSDLEWSSTEARQKDIRVDSSEDDS